MWFDSGAPGAPGAPPNPLGPGVGPQAVNRRMNAIKTNHPKDMIGPNMGKNEILPHSQGGIYLTTLSKSNEEN